MTIFEGYKPEPWTVDAACQYVDPELFFLEPGQTAKARIAKRICASCPVRRECGEWAFRVNDRFAVLGGTTEKDRRELRADRRYNRTHAA